MSYKCQSCKSSFTIFPNQEILQPSEEDGFTYYWHLVDITTDVSGKEVIQSFEEAFKAWSKYFYPLRFKSTSEIKKSQITIRFANNGDSDLPAAFEEGVLAYAYFPQTGSPFNGRIYFNDAWNWGKEHGRNNISLRLVQIHELGHCFGLGHTKDDPTDIMTASYDPNNSIKNDSALAIEQLYGAKKLEIFEKIQEEGEGYPKEIEPDFGGPGAYSPSFFREFYPTPESLDSLPDKEITKISKLLGVDNIKEVLYDDKRTNQ